MFLNLMVQTSATFGFKDTGIKKSEFVPKTLFLLVDLELPYDDNIFRQLKAKAFHDLQFFKSLKKCVGGGGAKPPFYNAHICNI